MLPAGVISRVDHDDEKVYVNRTKEQIKDAPEFDDAPYRDDAYRGELGSYYGAGGAGWRAVNRSRLSERPGTPAVPSAEERQVALAPGPRRDRAPEPLSSMRGEVPSSCAPARPRQPAATAQLGVFANEANTSSTPEPGARVGGAVRRVQLVDESLEIDFRPVHRVIVERARRSRRPQASESQPASFSRTRSLTTRGSALPRSPSSPGRRRSRAGPPCRPCTRPPGRVRLEDPRRSAAPARPTSETAFCARYGSAEKPGVAELRDRLVERGARDPVARLDELRQLRGVDRVGVDAGGDDAFAITFAAAFASAPAPPTRSRARRARR